MPSSSKNYQQLSNELAEIIAWFESSDVDLDLAVSKYEKAAKVMKEMQKYLSKVENKIKKITTNLE